MAAQISVAPGWKNKLYFGDNLVILREHVADESVDLVYLDPPFNSNANYNVLFGQKQSSEAGAQITAFEDTWHWGIEAEGAYRGAAGQGPDPARRTDARPALVPGPERHDGLPHHDGPAPHRAAPRPQTHREPVPPLRPHGESLLEAGVGCDLRTSENFRNEIIWRRTTSHSDAKRCGNVHDVILLYSQERDIQMEHSLSNTSILITSNPITAIEGCRMTGVFTSAIMSGRGEGPPRNFDVEGEHRTPPKGRHWMYDQGSDGLDACGGDGYSGRPMACRE